MRARNARTAPSEDLVDRCSCGALCVAGAVRADGVLTPVVSTAVPRGQCQELPVATRVVVYKAERRMELMRDEEVLRTLPGFRWACVPDGQKERDGRLPHARRALLPHAPQCAQRLLPVDPGVLPQRPRPCAMPGPMAGIRAARS